jgi:salicylate hydroxylase
MGFAEQRIAVIGGGLGGMSFMNAVLHVGLANVQLYERALDFKEVGAGINITRNANCILDSYGLKEAMTKKSSRDLPNYMEYHHYKTGEYLGHVEDSDEPKARLLHRAHLLDTLRERVPKDRLHLNKHLTAVTKSDDGKAYRLQFQDGSEIEADIVVGCDGIKSVIRQHLGITDEPEYSGQMVYRGFVEYDEHLPPATERLLRRTTNFRGPQRHILILPIGNDETKTAKAGIIGFMSESLDEWTSENWMARSDIDDLHKHVKDWCPAVQDIIAGLHRESPDGKMMKQALYSRKPADKWYELSGESNSSGIILLGDAVHSTLPHQGIPKSTG